MGLFNEVRKRKKVVIVGGGFGGLNAARSLRGANVDVTLIDRRNFHLFQPLLYQVATGALSPADISSPLRGILSRQPNVRAIQGTVTGVDVENQSVEVGDHRIQFDFLVVATGSRHHYFGNEHWETDAPGLKTVEDALQIRRKILSAFERAEAETDPSRLKRLLTFVVVGGGPTGVELAGAIGELANHTLKRDFRAIDPTSTKIFLVEGSDRVLPAYTSASSLHAANSLAELGVTVMTNSRVIGVDRNRVLLMTKNGDEVIDTETVLWGAGVQASPLGKHLAAATGCRTDRQGRVVVVSDLSLPENPNIFVIGDLAHCEQEDKPLPGVAPVAMQQGTFVADAITRRLRGHSARKFRYRDYGQMAVIGRAAAVAELGALRFRGYPAWLIWLFIHLINLVEYKSRVLVLIQWGWNYLTRNRSARLITYDHSDGRSQHRRDSDHGAPRSPQSRPITTLSEGSDEQSSTTSLQSLS